MPKSNDLTIFIGGRKVVVEDPEKIPVSINYRFEDENDFQQKKGVDAEAIRIPATLLNEAVGNTFHNAAVEDTSDGQAFRNIQTAVIRANGTELLTGKAILNEATHTDRPEEYEYDLYGGNTDWTIELQETTLYDCFAALSLYFTKNVIMDSWQYNGRDETKPFVFAPVRYREQMEQDDFNMMPAYMKPALSKYWALYWGFKKIGYRMVSEFMDTDFFRRQVMPWTWGNFLFSDGTRLANLDFLAKSIQETYIEGDFDGYVDLKVMNDSTIGAFDNSGTYEYDIPQMASKWTYKTAYNYGNLDATFRLHISLDATVSANSDITLKLRWYKNGQLQGEDLLVDLNAPTIGRRDQQGLRDIYRTINVNPGDVITTKFFLHNQETGAGRANIRMNVEEFALDYFRIPLGGRIDLANYPAFKKYKFLDFLRGIIDEFDLSVRTDNIAKLIYIEPTHPYQLPGETATRPGYFNGDFVDWSAKQDTAKKSTMRNFKEFEREVLFKYKPDGADGMQKMVTDRHANVLGAAKYVLPDRFKTGKKDYENRFFSPLIHYDVDQWAGITGTAPQMPVLVPENISNTSRNEAQNTFLPKSAYYKGVQPGWGWVFDGAFLTSFPFMFSVNYRPGGEFDPVLSYSNERVGVNIAKGLFSRFFVQRMAIMRNGQWYTTYFNLNNTDAARTLHREFKICRGQRWELVSINDYRPLSEQPTECLIRRWVPVGLPDRDATYPTENSIMRIDAVITGFDMRYSPLKCLTSDIPK